MRCREPVNCDSCTKYRKAIIDVQIRDEYIEEQKQEIERLKKIVELAELKRVDFFGLVFHIPTYYRYIAIDSDGMIYAYERKPEAIEGGWRPTFGGESTSLGSVELLCLDDWKHTLKEI